MKMIIYITPIFLLIAVNQNVTAQIRRLSKKKNDAYSVTK